MSHGVPPAAGRRAPRHSMMEMEEIFLQLCEEVTRLQDLCTKQGKLLQKLAARKGPILDIPVSLPIQCTEDMVTQEEERPPESHQKCPEALASSRSDPEGSAQPLAQLHAAGMLPALDGKHSPSTANTSVFGGGTGGAALAIAFGSNRAERSEKVDVDTWLQTCRMLPTVTAPREDVGAGCSPEEFVAPNPVAGDSFLTLLDLYEAPETLRMEDAPSESALPAEAKGPVEIRGPVKTSWTPGWVLEDGDGALGQGAGLASEGAQACDICQEMFPSDAAGQAGYLKHVLAHMK
ncbi:uncharacterized protein LOC130141157 [Falco biarmicus]|uniref:uncharacterized protein LOC114010984 n=1 Tax=Falco peregrinus TaxID=8954 RepID=UPI000FFC99A2|nr:uncharacterized protein LOC114010984 [Falco peregrinus]XP_027666998.2 uncharacterized protein LOC114016949 [Falco cherrug]XP_056177870.1 uncharacterized protein LOC130141157 [Falco biarmicus]